MKQFGIRLLKLFIGLIIFGLSTNLAIQSNIGLGPWDVLNQGMARTLGTTHGTMSITLGVFFVFLAGAVLKEPIGLGTLCNMVMVGLSVDFFGALGIIPHTTGLPMSIAMIFCCMCLNAFGTYLYMSAGFGSGPRDSVFVACVKRFPNTPIAVVKSLLEGSALLSGWLLGGTAGIGTVMIVFGTGIILQYIFKFFKSNPGKIKHENFFETMKSLTATLKDELHLKNI